MDRSPHPLKHLKAFWDRTGEFFPSLSGAPSTHHYFECEKTLFREYVPHLRGKKVLKTDLWDEAKNTKILKWVADQGADVFGIDISFPIVKDAKSLFFKGKTHGFIVSDIRKIAYESEAFDLIYSMGTVEHFPQSVQALKECYRVLRRGGKAIIGVPNKHDPFLRPLIVDILQGLGLYAYGYEKAFSRKALVCMLEEAGFKILAHSGILFMPGMLRLLDLFLHINLPKATILTRALMYPFAFLYKKILFFRRHGYLIACIVQKP